MWLWRESVTIQRDQTNFEKGVDIVSGEGYWFLRRNSVMSSTTKHNLNHPGQLNWRSQESEVSDDERQSIPAVFAMSYKQMMLSAVDSPV